MLRHRPRAGTAIGHSCLVLRNWPWRARPSVRARLCNERGGPFHKGGLRSTRPAMTLARRCSPKRHVLTDTIGLLLAVHVHPASVQDRDGAEALLREARRSFPFIERIIGDAGYQGQKMQAAVARPAVGASDRAPLRTAPVRRAAEKMDRGAHLGLDQPLSSAGARLRASRSQGGRVRPSRNDPSRVPAPRLNVLIRNRNSPEGL